MICISCSHEHDEKFCPNCGEKSGINRISAKSILQDGFSTITEMDKGFLYNLKMLTINPKKITTEFILGKRKGVLNPMSFLIISISMYLIVESFFKLPKSDINHEASSKFLKQGYDIGRASGQIIFAYFKYFWIFSIVLLANATKLCFQKYNYWEHLTISTFIIGQATLFGIIGFFIFKTPLILNPVLYLALFFLVYFIFKQHKDKFTPFLLSLSTIIIFTIQLFLMVLLLGILYLK